MEIPKQFLHIRNKPVILYTMEAFQKHPKIDEILVVTLQDWKELVWSYAKQYQITKLRWVVSGGNSGQESIQKGLQALKKECSDQDTIFIHDGNRPFVTQEIISDSLAVYQSRGGAVAAIPCMEAIYKSADGEKADRSFDRGEMYRTQTPHTYSLGKLLWAHKEAEKRQLTDTTATCTLMSLLGEEIYFSKGSEKNLKLTTAEDVDIFDALLQL